MSFQHYVIKDAQSNDVIHTAIHTTGYNINPILFSKQNNEAFEPAKKVMDSAVDVQEMHVDHRRKLSHPTTRKHRFSHHPSLSVSQIKKSSLARHYQSPPIHVSFFKIFFVIFYRR